MSTLAERIARRRQQIGLSKSDLARAVNVSRAAVTAWENGTSATVHSTLLFDLCKTLKCSPQWLATGKGSPEESLPSIDQELLTKCLRIAAEAAKESGKDIPQQTIARLAAFLYAAAMRHERVSVDTTIDLIDTFLIHNPA